MMLVLSCVFSADSSSVYAFADQDRQEQKREELVDFVRYLAFLNFVRSSTLSDTSPASSEKYKPVLFTTKKEPKLITDIW